MIAAVAATRHWLRAMTWLTHLANQHSITGRGATASLLPPLKESGVVDFRGLVTASGRTAQGVAKQFGFQFCAGDFNELLTADTDVVVVTTRHDSHASCCSIQRMESRHFK